MAKVHVKRNDLVYVLTGKDRAKTGKVLSVDASKNRVVVEGVNLVTKHRKPSAKNPNGGIEQFEAPIDASNVMLVCPKTKRPTKVAIRINEDGSKSRIAKCSGEVLPEPSYKD